MSDEHQELLNHDAEMVQGYGEIGLTAGAVGKAAGTAAEILEGSALPGTGVTEAGAALLDGAMTAGEIGAVDVVAAGATGAAELAVGAEATGLIGAAAVA